MCYPSVYSYSRHNRFRKEGCRYCPVSFWGPSDKFTSETSPGTSFLGRQCLSHTSARTRVWAGSLELKWPRSAAGPAAPQPPSRSLSSLNRGCWGARDQASKSQGDGGRYQGFRQRRGGRSYRPGRCGHFREHSTGPKLPPLPPGEKAEQPQSHRGWSRLATRSPERGRLALVGVRHVRGRHCPLGGYAVDTWCGAGAVSQSSGTAVVVAVPRERVLPVPPRPGRKSWPWQAWPK